MLRRPLTCLEICTEDLEEMEKAFTTLVHGEKPCETPKIYFEAMEQDSARILEVIPISISEATTPVPGSSSNTTSMTVPMETPQSPDNINVDATSDIVEQSTPGTGAGFFVDVSVLTSADEEVPFQETPQTTNLSMTNRPAPGALRNVVFGGEQELSFNVTSGSGGYQRQTSESGRGWGRGRGRGGYESRGRGGFDSRGGRGRGSFRGGERGRGGSVGAGSGRHLYHGYEGGNDEEAEEAPARKRFRADDGGAEENSSTQYGYQTSMVDKKKKQHTKFYYEDNEEDEEGGGDDTKKEEGAEEGDDAEKKKKPGQGGGKDEHSRLKQWRLIIRNLPFKTKVEDIQTACSKFGRFVEIVLPPGRDPKYPDSCRGFAFVQFIKKNAADRFKAHYAENTFLERMIAVDFSIPKDTFVTATYEEKKKLEKLVKVEKEDDDMKQAVEDLKSNPSVPTVSSEVGVVKFDSDEEMEDNEEKKSDDEASDDEESSDDEGEEKKDKSDDDEKDSDEESEDDSDGDEEESEKKPEKKQAPPPRRDIAVEEGRVVFLKSLSFQTTEEELKIEMEKYGTVKLCILCKFADSGHSKGTAFVHFSTKEEAQKCIAGVYAGEVVFDGRVVEGLIAVPKETAQGIERDRLQKGVKDKRNLHLMRAGLIRPGTAASNGMSEQDVEKRKKLAISAQHKLKDLKMFISPTRLVVHNLPFKLDDKELKRLCYEAVGRRESQITECRIWREAVQDKKTKGKSKGFGFVNFTEHYDALECLNKLNNNPDTFTPEKRPIVEFSIENIAALRMKEERRLKAIGQESRGKVDVRHLDANIEKQVDASKMKLSKGGMKPLPKKLGAKTRQRDSAKAKTATKKKVSSFIKKGKKTGKAVEHKANPSSGAAKGKKKTNKKTLTKFLAHG